MLLNIFLLILLFFVSLIPIVWWGYLFTYFDNSEFNRNRFFIWILAWVISVFPVLYLWEVFQKTNLSVFNPFYYVYHFDGFLSIFPLLWSFFVILFFLSSIPFLIFNAKIIKQKYMKYLKNFAVFAWFLTLFWFIIYILNAFFSIFSWLNFEFDSSVYFLDIAFNSLKLVILYYILVWILEELSKYFCFSFWKYFKIESVQQWVLYSIFIALWFGFIENILYFKSIYESSWFNSSLLSIYFSRNVFSVLLHVLCSAIFSYFFSNAYLKFKKINFEYLKTLFIWFFLAVFFHSLFDVFLTFKITIIIFLYLIFWYFYLTYIFYKE